MAVAHFISILKMVRRLCCYTILPCFVLFVSKRLFSVFLFRYLEGGSADEGDPPGGDPDVTLTLTMDILRKILRGESSAFSAYMTGELVIEGNVHAASHLAKLIDYIG